MSGTNNSSVPFLLPISETSAVVLSGLVTMVFAGCLHAAFRDRRRKKRVSAESSRSTNSMSSATEVSIDLVKYPGGQITVYYGTQTGTAESFARDLERQLQGFLVHVVDLEDVKNLKSLAERAIFLTATYGEGECPDNATQFCSWLENATGLAILTDASESSIGNAKLLSHMEYAVFGLGNKQYDHFNAMGKYFDQVFALLGAKRMADLGVGDDDDDIEADFENWKEKSLLPELQQQLKGAKLPNADSTKTLPECPIKILYHTDGAAPDYDLKPNQIHSSSRHHFGASKSAVTAVRSLRSSKDVRSTLHMELDATNLHYTTADNLGIMPVNDMAVVHRLAKALGFKDHLLETALSLEASENAEWHGVQFPQPETVGNILLHYYDIQAAPRRADLAALADYCSEKVDREFLLRLASKEGRAEYKEKILGQYTGWVEVMERLPSLKIPLDHLFNLLPPLQQRFYTIASSSSLHPDSIHLTVAITEHERPGKKDSLFQGVCTRHLAQSALQQKLLVTVRPSSFRLPPSPSTPIILIGPGTGVAPMRALLQERTFLKSQNSSTTLGTAVLYFGCQHEDKDFLYREEFASMQKDGVLNHLRVAFSRQERNKKVYVQHLLKENAKETWELLDQQGAHVYVCGGVQMGNDVNEALSAIVAAHSKSGRSGKEYLTQLSQTGRYVQELWA